METKTPLTDSEKSDLAAQMVAERDESRDWQLDAYWPQWEQAYKDYKCYVDPRKDSDGKIDPERTHVGMPDTFSMVNRRTARVTAQIPNIGFIANDRNEELERAVSVKCMSDWDNGGVQRFQKKHVRQGEMFGYSVRGWWWEVSEFERRRGVAITGGQLNPSDIEIVSKTYKVDPQMLAEDPAVLAALVERFAKRGLLDVRYTYKAFEGPRSEVLFVGDCYPEPHFESIQTSGRFIVEKPRDRDWLERLAKRFPAFAAGVTQLFEDFPDGSENGGRGKGDEGSDLRDKMRSAIGMPTQASTMAKRTAKHSKLWSVMARWIPGPKPKLAYVAERSVWLGEIDSPYNLDGKIPFTELILLDDILGGIGDSLARITAGLQQMHNVSTNRRFDIFRHISQPMLGTSDRAVYDNPEVLSRDLFRLVMLRGGQNSIFPINDTQAMAAMAQTMGEESAIQRMYQVASGDSNLSMGANVDPAQLRTATGAKLLAAGLDVLSKDQVDMFNQTSVRPDVEMIYLFNRSEMADAIPVEASLYQRNYDVNTDRRKQEWLTAEPIHFQADGKLTVELGSTLADDEETNVVKATNMYSLLAGNPDVNQQAITKDVIIAHGKGPRLAEYMQPQQPPPQEPPIKGSLSVSLDMEKTDPATQKAVLSLAGVTPELVEQMSQQVAQEAAAQNGMAPPAAPMQPPPADMPVEGMPVQ